MQKPIIIELEEGLRIVRNTLKEASKERDSLLYSITQINKELKLLKDYLGVELKELIIKKESK